MDQKEQEELDQQQQTALDKEQEMDDDGAATVHTYKKSQYWTKEVEEKLGLGGADPYGLLELEERRWRASADEIRKAYRKLVLTKHPDKKAAMDAATPKKPEKKRSEDDDDDEGEEKEGGEEEEDAEFKLLSIAWELLGNTETRRQYDSIDNFNDFLPTTFRPNKDVPENLRESKPEVTHRCGRRTMRRTPLCHALVDYTSITTGTVAVTSARTSAAAVVSGGGAPLTADAAGADPGALCNGAAYVSVAT